MRTIRFLGDMIAIGRHAKLQVIAEGVESQLHCDILTTMGCQHFQGYLFSRPLPEPDFLRWITERRPDSGVQPCSLSLD